MKNERPSYMPTTVTPPTILCLGGPFDGERISADDPLPGGYEVRYVGCIVPTPYNPRGCPREVEADGAVREHRHPVYVFPGYSGKPRW